MLLEFRSSGLLPPQTPQSAAGRLFRPKGFLPYRLLKYRNENKTKEKEDKENDIAVLI